MFGQNNNGNTTHCCNPKIKMKTKDFSSSFTIFLLTLSTVYGEVVVNPTTAVYVVEGSQFFISCSLNSSGSANNLRFGRGDNKVITESDVSGGRMTINKTSDGNLKMISMTVTNVQLTDTVIEDTNCVDGGASHGYTVYIIPKASEPSIILKPNETTAKKDTSVTFECSTSTVITDKVLGVDLKWRFKDLDNQKLSDSERHTITPGKDLATEKSSKLTVKQVDIRDHGTYYCYGVLLLKDSKDSERRFFKTSNITSVTWETDSKSSEGEVESKEGESVAITCSLSGYPIPTISWKKNVDVITESSDTRYTFSNSSSIMYIPNNVFTLSDLRYTDRALYTCIGEYKDTIDKPKIIEKRFRLRVRDPLGALWPVIGIIVEAVLLFIIIGIYECVRARRIPNGDKVDSVDGKKKSEKSPLVNQETVVSYHSGDDGVRSRINTGVDEPTA